MERTRHAWFDLPGRGRSVGGRERESEVSSDAGRTWQGCQAARRVDSICMAPVRIFMGRTGRDGPKVADGARDRPQRLCAARPSRQGQTQLSHQPRRTNRSHCGLAVRPIDPTGLLAVHAISAARLAGATKVATTPSSFLGVSARARTGQCLEDPPTSPPCDSTGAQPGGSAGGRLAHALPPQRAAQHREADRQVTSSGGPAADVTPSAATDAAVEPVRAQQCLSGPSIGRGG